MDAPKYIAAEDGSLTGCEHDLKLAVWNTNNAGTPTYPPGPANHYILWLEWEAGGSFDHELVEHHLQLDNTAPSIAPLPDGLQVRLKDGTIVPICEVDKPVTDAESEVWGQFEDEHYWNFTLTLKGGMGDTLSYTHNYYDPTDGPPGLKNTDDTGTMPDAKTVHLRNILMTELGKDKYVKCCYLLELKAHDAVFRHSFDRITPTFFADHHENSTFITSLLPRLSPPNRRGGVQPDAASPDAKYKILPSPGHRAPVLNTLIYSSSSRIRQRSETGSMIEVG